MEKLYSKYLQIFLIFILFFSNTYLSGQQNNGYLNLDNDKYLILLNPRGTEIYDLDSQILIEWDFKGVDNIRIEFLNNDDRWETLANEVKATDKKFYLEVNAKLPKLLKLRIIDITDSSIYDITPYYIEIKVPLGRILFNSNAELNKSSNLSTFKIMPLGNSITQGYTIPVPDHRDGYRKSLKILLENNGLNFDFVGSKTDGSFSDNQHEGHGGWHSKHWYNNKKFSIADSLTKFLTLNSPDIILLHVGTNDIGEYFDSRNDNSIDSTVTDISGLLDTIYNFDPTIKIILAKIVNRTDDNSTVAINENDTTTAFNIALQNMADTRIINGDNLSTVDMENALLYPDDLSDGVHPNSVGYAKMARVWFDGIISTLPKLNTKIFLEGAYAEGSIMNSNLSLSNNQPFNQSPYYFGGTEYFNAIPNDVIDWVLVSLRTDTSPTTEVAKRACFVKNNGTVVDLDGFSSLAFVVDPGYYYIVVEQRNHLPIMSSTKVLVVP